jgi:hypothetical protein
MEKKEEIKVERKPQQKKRNQIVYIGKTAWRFYSALFTEALLGLVLVAPFYAIFYFTETTKITIPTTLPVLWSISTALFILQGLMFSTKGGN